MHVPDFLVVLTVQEPPLPEGPGGWRGGWFFAGSACSRSVGTYVVSVPGVSESPLP